MNSPAKVLGKSYFEFSALTTIDMFNQKVFRNSAFIWSKRFTIPSLGTVDIVFDSTGVPSNKTVMVLPEVFTAIGAGPINIDLYFGTTITPATGTVWEGANNDARSLATPDTIITFNPTVTDPGTKAPGEFMIPSNGTPAVSVAGGTAGRDTVFIAQTDVLDMFRLVNTDNAVASCSFLTTVFEAEIGK